MSSSMSRTKRPRMFPQAAQVLVSHLEEITALLQERKEQILAS